MDRKVINITDNCLEYSKLLNTPRGQCLVQKRVTVSNGKVSMKIRKRFLNN